MNKHPVYGLLYIILLPFAFLLGLSVLTSLPIALGVPILLIPVFVMACFVIYTVATLIFYIKAIQQEKICKPTLRDWIRVNAFVVIIPTALIVMNCIAVAVQPSLINALNQQVKEFQPQSQSLSPQFIKGMLYVLLVFAAVLLVHIIYTFRLLKTYQASFRLSASDNEL